MKRKREDEQNENDLQEADYMCALCSKKFKKIKSLNQHMESHIAKRKCDLCQNSYARQVDLNKHKSREHGIKYEKRKKDVSFTCEFCNKTFAKRYNLDRHNASVHGHHSKRIKSVPFACRHCEREFDNYAELFQHVQTEHPMNQEGGRMVVRDKTLDTNKKEGLSENETMTNDRQVDDETVFRDSISQNKTEQEHRQTNNESAFQDSVSNRYIFPKSNEQYDVLSFFANVREKIRSLLEERKRNLGGIKWNLCVQVEMQRDDGNELTTASPFFRSGTYMLLQGEDLNEHMLNTAMQKMYQSLETFMKEGSNFYVKKVLKLEIHTVVYRPLTGSTYIPLPKTLACSGSILNIHNNNNKCFLYCLLASLHPVNNKPECVGHYMAFEHEINMTGVSYPISISEIYKVENKNENISINVFTYEDSSILPLRITKHVGRVHHVNLLWLKLGNNEHYCLIRDLNRFLSRTKPNQHHKYFCNYCLHGFKDERLLQEHQSYCSSNGPQRIDLPTPDKNILKFKEFDRMLKIPFVIYADFETINVKLHTCLPDPKKSFNTPTTKLEVCGFAYKVVSEDERYTKPTVVYNGSDSSERLIECLLEERQEIITILQNIEPMSITEEDQKLINTTMHCCICQKKFSLYDTSYEKKVRHHNHLTGKFIGMAHNVCNINCKQANFTPVFFHGLKGFDSHILCQSLGLFKTKRLTCIAQNSEKYVSFSLGGLRFLDSYQFLPSSLDTLVKNLAQEGLDAFPHLLKEFQSRDDAMLLLRKGVYPYEYMDSFDKFDEDKIPSKEMFYSSIKREHISNEDYDYVHKIFQHFKMTSLRHLHDLYVKTDTILLSSIFESFRNMCMLHYGLDPCHFYTSPGLSWTSCLKMSGVQLELLTDIDQMLMIEAGIRGGVSQISNRYAKANNEYLPDYNPSIPSRHILYIDANNLYGYSMQACLPVGDFAFLKDNAIKEFDVTKIQEHGDTGYILEVSLQYPSHLHDLHNCFPLAPENKFIDDEQLSSHARHLLQQLHGKTDSDPLTCRGKVKKRVTTLEDKDRYIVHYRNLQLYLRLGMQIKTIHRILKFRQEAWMKSYIDYNTEMRKQATSAFQKNFYKLMNVSAFGKTMENKRKHKDIQLIHTERRLKKVAAKPTYKHTTIFNSDLVAVELSKRKVCLDRPSYCGFAILDLSKWWMYSFWYDYIKAKYGNKAILHMTDTDSLLFSCETDDIYQDMSEDLDLFDTSDYPEDHPLHSQLNKKVLGKFKDESNGKVVTEFIGLRSKMYSYVCDEKEEKRAKGISKVTVKKDLKHSHYKNVLFNETSSISTMHSLTSRGHVLYGETIQKQSLSAFDDKRYLLNNVESYAYGHYKINLQNVNQDNNILLKNRQNVAPLDAHSFTVGSFNVTPCCIINE